MMPAPVQEFTLPLGYRDPQGRLHQHGLMRLATARDEIEPLSDPRVQSNEAMLGLLLLSRVVTRLGDHSPVSPELIGSLYAADFSYLQELYMALNTPGQLPPVRASSAFSTSSATLPPIIQTTCPNCQAELTLDLTEQGS